MRWPAVLAAAVMLSTAAFGDGFPIGIKVASIQVTDNSVPVTLSPSTAPATVVIFISTKCPISNSYNERMSAIYHDYSSRSVQFVFVNANANETPEEIRGTRQGESVRVQGLQGHQRCPCRPVRRDGDSGSVRVQSGRSASISRPRGRCVERGSGAGARFAESDGRGARRAAGGIAEDEGVRLHYQARTQKHLKALLLISSFISTCRVHAADKLIPIDEAGVRKLIESRRGSVVLVSFWATWCEPCRAELPHIVALAERLRSKPFKLVIISADEPEQEMEAYRFLNSKKFSGTAYIKRAKSDENSSTAWILIGVARFPLSSSSIETAAESSPGSGKRPSRRSNCHPPFPFSRLTVSFRSRISSYWVLYYDKNSTMVLVAPT